MTPAMATVKAAVLAKLQALTKLKYVYQYEKGAIEGFPAATLYLAEYSADWVTNRHDKDIYTFTINLYQEIKNQTPAQAEPIMDAALTELIQAFQADWNLGGAVDAVHVRASCGWTLKDVDTRVAVVKLTCEKLTSIL